MLRRYRKERPKTMPDVRDLLAVIDPDVIVPRIRRWAEVETPSRDAAAVNRLMDIVESEAREAGLVATREPGSEGFGDILKLESRPDDNGPRLLIVTHIDTVHPIGTLDDLPVRRDGDKLFGPGVYDMKGGAYLAFEAYRALARINEAPNLPLTFLVMPDEEAGSPIGRHTIEAEAKRACAALVVEPAREGGKIVTARNGAARYYLSAVGKPAHSGSRHQDGASAIREIAAKTVGLEAMTNYGKGTTVNVGVIEAGTAVNVIPARAEAEIDIRMPDLETAEAIEARMSSLEAEIPGVTLTVSGGLNRPPMERTSDVSALFELAQSHADDIGFELETVPRTGGGSDGNFTAALGVPTLDGLGVDGAGAHTLEEHLLVSSIRPRTALLARLYATIGPEMFE